MFNSQKGFNLLEILTTMAVAITTITVAVPATRNTLERRNVSAAAEEIYTFARLARTESIKRNRSVFVSLKTDNNTNWCVGISQTAGCDCYTSGACQLDGMERVVGSDDYADISLTQTFTGGSTGFDARRGLAISTGQARIGSDNHTLDVRVSALGHVRMCSPDNTSPVSGVSGC